MLTALWEASDRVCGKRRKVMIPTLLPALERNDRLTLDRDHVLTVSVASTDRLLGGVRGAGSSGKRRRTGFSSAIQRKVPIRTFNDWKNPRPGFREVDSWTECARDGALVVEAIKYLQSQLPWLLIGVDFDDDSAFMNDVVIPWCRTRKLEVTRL